MYSTVKFDDIFDIFSFEINYFLLRVFGYEPNLELV